MTKRYACIIQEGQAAEREKAALEASLRSLGERTFGDEARDTEVEWIVMEKGYAWTAGEPSRASIVVRSVPVGLPLEQREAFMREVCDLWSAQTGCHIDDVVVTAWDGPLPL